MFGSLTKGLIKSVNSAVRDPVGTAVDAATAPIRQTVNIVDGLTEGKIRYKACMALGTDVALGMTTALLMEWYLGEVSDPASSIDFNS